MSKLFSTLIALHLVFGAYANGPERLRHNFQQGDPGIKSINALEFGPDGILFIGDSENAKVFALEVGEAAPVEVAPMESVDQAIATKLGTTSEKITITDMALDPRSKKIFFSIHHLDATPILVALHGEEWEVIDLSEVSYSAASINQPVAADAEDGRGRPLRKWAISDITYYDNQVMVSGLSNQEFGSTFRSIAFPFDEGQSQSSLEIYHAAHGKYETHAPIKTFTAAEIGGKGHMIASYTCTPLVLFPLDQLKAGEHVKGRTVAELGNANTPLDMIVMEKEGNQYLLMANSRRALMKIKFSDIEAFQASLTTPVEERSGTAGVDFIALPFVNVLQLDKIDDSSWVMLQRNAEGKLNLSTQSIRWL